MPETYATVLYGYFQYFTEWRSTSWHFATRDALFNAELGSFEELSGNTECPAKKNPLYRRRMLVFSISHLGL
jgi:hypothetical protein